MRSALNRFRVIVPAAMVSAVSSAMDTPRVAVVITGNTASPGPTVGKLASKVSGLARSKQPHSDGPLAGLRIGGDNRDGPELAALHDDQFVAGQQKLNRECAGVVVHQRVKHVASVLREGLKP